MRIFLSHTCFLKKPYFVFIFCIIFSIIVSSTANASQVVSKQVVSKEDRAWVREAIKLERSEKPTLNLNTMAVLYFRNMTLRDTLNPLQKGFAYLLMTDLSQIENIQVVERVKLQALVEELNFGASGIVDAESAPKIGKILRANYLVEGEILSDNGGDLKVVSGLMSLNDNRILGQPDSQGRLEDIFIMEKKILFGIIDILKIELSPAQRSDLNKPITTNLNAFMDFIRGMECSDAENYKEAQEYYLKSLKEDPTLKPAQDALKELEFLKLIANNAKSRIMIETLMSRTLKTDSLSNELSTRDSDDKGLIEQREAQTGNLKVKW